MIDFVPLPDNEKLVATWPTPNQLLKSAPERFFARTSANPDYGKPGWTRECGKRFHKGCDIAPIDIAATGETTNVIFTDCETDTEYESEEPTFIPHDPIFAVYEGTVVEAIDEERASDYGKHIVIQHTWPRCGLPFYTLYGHLADLSVTEGQEVATGDRIGTMGQTSRIPDARIWMSIAPHLHFEVWDGEKRCFNPDHLLKAYLEPRVDTNIHE